VVENQAGPGGIAAARTVTSAPPDGHTLGLLTNGTAISVGAYNALPFDPVKDFAPISALGTFSLVFATNSQSQFKTLGDVIKAAREAPGKLNVGTINVGGTQNLAAELFKSTVGLNFQIIPYRGTPEVLIGLLRNDVHMMVEFYAPLKGALAEQADRDRGHRGKPRPGLRCDRARDDEHGRDHQHRIAKEAVDRQPERRDNQDQRGELQPGLVLRGVGWIQCSAPDFAGR
jgi:hypothetical protein